MKHSWIKTLNFPLWAYFFFFNNLMLQDAELQTATDLYEN